ncbi:MAG: hypothetical protein IJ187_09910 [Neisseriaceae bacterium]|nr:hypothetical protein [Neisseriaceae bacterium]
MLNEVSRIDDLFCGLNFFVCPLNHFFNHDFFYGTDKGVHKVKVYGVVLLVGWVSNPPTHRKVR